MNRIPIDVERIKRLAKQAVGSSITESIPARLGHPVPASVTDPIKVPETIAGAPGYVYIRGIADSDAGDLQGVSMALNEGTGKLRREDMVYGAFIRVRKRKNGGFIVDGTDTESNAQYMGKLVVHPQTSTVLSQFDNGLLQPTQPPSMKAGVGYGTYRYLGRVCRVVSQMTKDFTADVPGTAGQARAVAVEVNPVDNTLFYTNGSTFTATLTDQEAFDGGYLPQPSNALMCGWVKLVNGMTAIRHLVNIIPAHEVMAVDRFPVSLGHVVIIGTNQQIVAHKSTVTGSGRWTVTGTAILHFT